jgi:hypothetical protein
VATPALVAEKAPADTGCAKPKAAAPVETASVKEPAEGASAGISNAR